MAVHSVGMRLFLARGDGVLVNHQLMTEEIEVDPMLAAAAFGAAEHLAIETPGGGQVMHGDGEVEGR